MFSNFNKFYIFSIFLAVTVLSGCLSEDEPSPGALAGNVSVNASGPIRVATTIAPLGDFVRAVGGDKVAVTVVVPPGAEPHTFEPTPSLIYLS
jgi:ABC-type Zn uptake system ZnuABC Zn-binding protein ZnuA